MYTNSLESVATLSKQNRGLMIGNSFRCLSILSIYIETLRNEVLMFMEPCKLANDFVDTALTTGMVQPRDTASIVKMFYKLSVRFPQTSIKYGALSDGFAIGNSIC